MLGKVLKKYRLDHNLSQEEMAKRLRTSQGYYCLIETGKLKPGIQLIDRISRVTGLSVSIIRGLL